MELPEEIRSGPYRVAVLSGGSGSEREVSLVSGKSIDAAFRAMGIPCDLFEMKSDALPDGLSRETHLILPIVHGTYGEDGRLSAVLEENDFAYAGCDQAASVLCFDKLACKAVAAHLGIPVARDLLLPQGHTLSYNTIHEVLGERLILKPRRDGSSVGLHLVQDQAGFDAAGEDMARADYLAEAYMDGYDLTVGVLGGEPLGVVGVHPDGGLYDYQHKYTTGMSRYEVPATIDPDMTRQLQDWTQLIFQACGCRDLARVDYRLGTDGSVIFLEINTLPGMTPTSLLPKTAQCMGISFDELVLSWAQFALNRMKARA